MRKLYLGLSFAAMAALAACDGSGTNANTELLGNSSNSSSESVDEYDGTVEGLGDLPKCGAKKEGKVYYVKDEGVAYTCRYDEDEETGEWVKKKKKNKDDDSSSSSKDVAIVDPSTVVKGTMTDERDGQTYRTVKIGNQVLMAENLNYRYLGRTPKGDSSSFCNGRYEFGDSDCTKYGRFYLWSAVMDSAGVIEGNTANSCGDYGPDNYYEGGRPLDDYPECTLGGTVRGVCPKGWHLPSKAEWNTLITSVGGQDNAARDLRSQAGWYNDDNGTDAYGFSALPGGYSCCSDHDFKRDGDGIAVFWSSTEYDSHLAYAMDLMLNDNHDSAEVHEGQKSLGFNVRCLKD